MYKAYPFLAAKLLTFLAFIIFHSIHWKFVMVPTACQTKAFIFSLPWLSHFVSHYTVDEFIVGLLSLHWASPLPSGSDWSLAQSSCCDGTAVGSGKRLPVDCIPLIQLVCLFVSVLDVRVCEGNGGLWTDAERRGKVISLKDLLGLRTTAF